MGRVNLFKQPDGWRATIENAGRTVVVEGLFDNEIEAAHAAYATQDRKFY